MLRTGLILLLLAGCGAAPAPGPSAQGGAVVASQGGSLNAIRTGRGLSALNQSPTLTRIAQAHATDMQRNAFFSHTGSNGSSVGTRARGSGYRYCRIAENIAQGQPNQAEVMTVWMNSSGHRRNMLNSDVTEYGLGRSSDNHWVLVLGRPGC